LEFGANVSAIADKQSVAGSVEFSEEKAVEQAPPKGAI